MDYESFVDQVASRLQQAQLSGGLPEGADVALLGRNPSSACQGVLLDWARDSVTPSRRRSAGCVAASPCR